MKRIKHLRIRDPYDEVRTICTDLPYAVHGTCYHDDDGNAYIVINARMSRSQQEQSWRHEYRHIRSDEMYDPAYHEYGEDEDICQNG